MKRTLLFLLAVAFGFSAYADGYRSYNMACELYKSGRYEEAKQRFMICVRYYPDDNLEWSIIEQRVKDCDARINEEANRRKAYVAQMAKAREEERRKYEEQQKLRKERKLVYVSVNASTLDGEYLDFKSDIVGALAPYGYRTTNNKDDAYWIVYVSADVLKLSKPGESDPNHIVEVRAHYTIENAVEGYNPAGGEGRCDAKGTSKIDYTKSAYDAYANLEDSMGKAIHNAIANIYPELTAEPDNIIAVKVSGAISDGQIQTAIDAFMRVLQKYSKYKVVDRTVEVIDEARMAEIGHNEIWGSSSSRKGAIGSDIHPRYICNIDVKKRSENDYYLSAHITNILNTSTEGTSGYPLGAQDPITKITPELIYKAALYITRDLDAITRDIVKSDMKQSLEDEINKYEKAVENRNKKKLSANLTAAGASLAVPGLGLVLKGHNEGYAYLGAEAALCLGGVMVPELMRKSYINKRNNETNANNRDVYTARANSCRKVSIICGACAGVLHVVNIVHSFMAEPNSNKNPKIQWDVAAIPVENGFSSDYAMGLSLSYRF